MTEPGHKTTYYNIPLYEKFRNDESIKIVEWWCTLAWKIPWMEELGRLQSMGSLRVGYD